MHRARRPQTAGDHLDWDTVPSGGRSAGRSVQLHGPFQASELGRVFRDVARSECAGLSNSRSNERVAKLHGRNDGEPGNDDRPDDVGHVTATGAVLHSCSERRLIRRILAALSGDANNDHPETAADRPAGRLSGNALGDVAQRHRRLPCIALACIGGPPRLDRLDLFGVDAGRPYVRIDGFALVPALDGCKIVELSANVAILETPGGVRQSYRRKIGLAGRIPVWDLVP
jgi:hypothetical protein